MLVGADGILLAVGIALLFAAVLLLGPVMARPIARLLGAPVQRWRGVTGAMARGNVQRNPRRTARTAAPVLIGVALVTGASVFAASIKEQIRDDDRVDVRRRLRRSTRSNGGSVSFSQTFIDELNTLPEVGAATGLGFVPHRRRRRRTCRRGDDRSADGRRIVEVRVRRRDRSTRSRPTAC